MVAEDQYHLPGLLRLLAARPIALVDDGAPEGYEPEQDEVGAGRLEGRDVLPDGEGAGDADEEREDGQQAPG